MERTERFCASCKAVLGSMYGGKVCNDCKEEKKEKSKRENAEQAHKNGLILVHSCISDPRNKAEYECFCRRWVTLEVASEMCRRGEVVDFETRAEFFFGKGRDVLTTRKKLRAPRAATVTKTEIERSIADIARRKELLEQVPSELREEVEELLNAKTRPLTNRVPTITQTHIEQAWHTKSDKAEEERQRIEIYHELTTETWRSLIRIVPAEEYDALKAQQIDVPVIWCGIGQDNRTEGGVGRTIRSPQTDEESVMYEEEDEDAPTDSEDQETAEASEPEAGDQDIESDEYLSDRAIDSNADEPDEFQQADDEEIAAA